MAKITEYHRQVTAQKLASVAFWQKHPMSHEECVKQFAGLCLPAFLKKKNKLSFVAKF